MKKRIIIIAIAVIAVIAGLFYFLSRPDLSGSIVIPYISHQKPAIDPHLPSSNALSDKLDDVEFDGLFDLTASPSGVVYDDGLGSFVGIDQNNVVTIRLNTDRRWHDSYAVSASDDKVTIRKGQDHFFSAEDLRFTLNRIQSLGSLSPDYILVSQAIDPMGFEGPNDQGQVRFQFKGDRIWKEADIKEVLSFKILPANSPLNALNYRVGTAAYMALPPKEGVSNYYRSPDGGAVIPNIILSPFIDNSTYTTELRKNNINVLLDAPFGALSPILSDATKYFTKSNISSTYFALLFNTQRLNRDQRIQVRRLIDNRTILERFFKVGTEQERHIVDYKGNKDNYYDYLNRSVFPSSSYYVAEKVVEPQPDQEPPDMGLLPDTVRVQVCENYGYREEYGELVDILNDPSVTHGRVHVTAVTNDEIKKGNYDALLLAISGYRSNFLFDLYNLFLREPDLEVYKINLVTEPDAQGNTTVSWNSFEADKNFFRLDATMDSPEQPDTRQLLQYIYAFMSTRQIGDKQEYARRIDELEHRMSLGAWLFSLPSLAYLTTQFDSSSINMYGVAAQLSSVKRWREQAK